MKAVAKINEHQRRSPSRDRTLSKYLVGVALLVAGVLFAADKPVQANNFGAIAYDETKGVSGLAKNRPSQDAANQAAIAECAKSGGGCVVVMRFVNECAAYARSPKGDSGWATAWTKRAAESTAMSYCKRYGRSCQVVASACTLPPPARNRNPNQPGSIPGRNTYETMKEDCINAGGGALRGSECVRY
jgi:hypothetical protein